MVRKLAILICVIAGLWCLLALGDSWDWTRPAWQKLMPEVILPRRPSQSELQIAQVEARLVELRHQIASAEQIHNDLVHQRGGLVAKLREQIGPHTSCLPAEAKQLLKDSPIAVALIRSIDALDRRDAELSRELAGLRSELELTEARLIALRNGVGLIEVTEPSRPSDGLRPERVGGADERYQRILCEAMGLESQPERNE
jgi:hypothetical protein